MADRISYRKLPGRRRGFLKGASVWLGADHLLLVKSVRFREEYKRYHLRDIQAIAIARRPRFHISTRAFAIAWLWLIAFFVVSLRRNNGAMILLAVVAVVLAATWIYVSAACSCTCRIYTAVSRDELPSVYRTWVANKFLRALEPEIAAAQGALEGAWIDAVANQTVGPPESLPPQAGVEQAGTPAATAIQSSSYYLLVSSLFVDGLWHAFALYHPIAWASIASNLLALLVIGASILVLVQYHLRTIHPAQHKLAIVALIAMGLMYYVRLTVVGALAGAKGAMEKKAVSFDYSGGPVSGEIEMGITLLLGLAGLVILAAGRAGSRGPRSMPS